MGVVKIGISLPRPLLERVDAIAHRKGLSRSEFVRRSLARALSEEIPPRVLAEARALYAAIEGLPGGGRGDPASVRGGRAVKVPRRGEIYYLDFSPAKGSEMREPHPALIIQNDVGNRVSRLTIVVAITSNLRAARLPVCVQVSPADSGLPCESVMNLGHIYTVDKSRLRQLVGRLPDGLMEQVDQALQVSVGLQPFEL